MMGSSDNSGGVVVGALVRGIECSGFKSRFILGFFFTSRNFLSSRGISVHEIRSVRSAPMPRDQISLCTDLLIGI